MMQRYAKIIWILLFLANPVGLAMAEEYFGEFIGNPKLEEIEQVDDRPTFKLIEEFKFVDPNGFEWKVPSGYQPLDGASIPRGFWSITGGPFSGRYLKASIIHDYYCVAKTRTTHDTHRNFYYAMRANGVPRYKALPMYLAVATFGPKWKIGIQRKLCLSGEISCNSLPDAENVQQSIDLAEASISIEGLEELFDETIDSVLEVGTVESGDDENSLLDILDKASVLLMEKAQNK